MGDPRIGVVRATVLTGLGAAVLAAAPSAPVSAQEAHRVPAVAGGCAPDTGRDPFAGPAAPCPGAVKAKRPAGLAGLAVDDALLRGIVWSRKGAAAFVEAPDGRTYMVRSADRLYDAAVQEIAADAVVFLRDAAPVGSRQVRKRLRGTEDAR